MELFRREALDGQDRLHGDIVFVPQVSWRLLGLFFAAAFAGAAFFLLTAQYRPASLVAGRLAAHEGSLVASFEMPAAAAEAIRAGDPLRLTVPGVAGTFGARVSAVAPAIGGSSTVRATLDDRAAPPLPPGAAVRAALPARSRSLAAWLYDALRSERP
jgi:hypothetical protein